MTAAPEHPKIAHITHVDNLPAILREGSLVSDRLMLERGGPVRAIGMSSIKRRRVEELEVSCHPGAKVGDFVPFYFCPRSIMLYVIHRANHEELAYKGGQDPIVHLVADLRRVVAWAESYHVPWCFSLSNAGAYYAEFRSSLDHLDELNWPAIAASDFRHPDVKEAKQAEFLLHRSFPVELIERIGVRTAEMRERVLAACGTLQSPPPIEVLPEWYF